MRTGQVIGSTDAHAAEVKDRPVHFQEVFATLYRNIGIDTSIATIKERSPENLTPNTFWPRPRPFPRRGPKHRSETCCTTPNCGRAGNDVPC